MDIDEYQQAAAETAYYPDDHAIVYPAMGLAGEAGEVANLAKRILRGDAPDDLRDRVLDELGDVLWYVAVTALDLGASLSEVAGRNVEKLRRRHG